MKEVTIQDVKGHIVKLKVKRYYGNGKNTIAECRTDTNERHNFYVRDIKEQIRSGKPMKILAVVKSKEYKKVKPDNEATERMLLSVLAGI